MRDESISRRGYDSPKGNFMKIDRCQHGFLHFLPLAVRRVDPPFRRQHDSIDPVIIARVVEPFGSTEDVDGVFQSVEETILPEIGDLFPCMSGDVIRKRDFQWTPPFSVLLPPLEFLPGKTR
jgi:hypothetical protein